MEYPFIVLWGNEVYDSGHQVNQILKTRLNDIDWRKPIQIIHGFKALTLHVEEAGVKIISPLAMVHHKVTKMLLSMCIDLIDVKNRDNINNMIQFLLFAWNFTCMEYGEMPPSLQYVEKEQLTTEVKALMKNEVNVYHPGRKDYIIFNKNAMLMGLCIFQEVICHATAVDIYINDETVEAVCHIKLCAGFNMEFSSLLFKAYHFTVENERATFVFERHYSNTLHLKSLHVGIFDPHEYIVDDLDMYLRQLDINTFICRTKQELSLYARMSEVHFVICTENVDVKGVKVIGVGVPGDYHVPIQKLNFDDIFSLLSQTTTCGPLRVGVMVRNLIIGSKLRFQIERNLNTQYIKVYSKNNSKLFDGIDHLIMSDDYDFILYKNKRQHKNITLLTNKDMKFKILYPEISAFLPKTVDVDISDLFE